MYAYLVCDLGVATLHNNCHGVDAPARLLVQVGFDDFVGPGLKTVHATNGDVLLQGGEHGFDSTLEFAHGRFSALTNLGGNFVHQSGELL